MTTPNSSGNGTLARLPDAYWFLTQSTYLLQRFIVLPNQSRQDALNELLKQYAEAVKAGHVQTPNIHGVSQ